MSTLLLVGNFRNLGAVLTSIKGHRLVHCHSIDSLRNEWGKGEVRAVALAVEELTPGIYDLLREGQQRLPGVKWILFVQRAAGPLGIYNSPQQIFFQGQVDVDWGPRLKRWLSEERLDHRRTFRQGCQGGVRLKDSDYSRKSINQKIFGTVANLSPYGLGLLFESEPPFPEGEFVEVAFRDAQGQARQFHAQIRWMKALPGGGSEVGLQFLAAAV